MGRGLGVSAGLAVDVGVDVGVAVGEAVGVAVDVGVGVVVGVCVAVAVGVAVAVAVPVEVAVAVAVGVRVGVGVGVGCTSNDPTSMRPLNTRTNPGPRWSYAGGGVKFGSPASMAGLPGNRAWVKVGPPLFCKGPNIGSVLVWSPGPFRKPLPLSLQTLYPCEVTVPPLLKMLVPEVPAFRIVFPSSSGPVT